MGDERPLLVHCSGLVLAFDEHGGVSKPARTEDQTERTE